MNGGIRLLRGQRRADGPCMSRYPVEQRTLSRLLVDQAKSFPDRTWLIFDSRTALSFGAALDGSRRVAARLQSDFPPPARGGLRVGLMLRNCPEFLLMLHGTFLAGGVAFLFDPDLPPQALRTLLERCAPQVLLVDAESAGAARAAVTGAVAPRIVAADQDWSGWIGDAVAGGALRLPSYDADALVMFTSGTTGIPKGVVASHHYAFQYSAVGSDNLGRNAADVLTGPLPLFHASGLHMIAHSALQIGGVGHLKRRFSASRYWAEAAADGATQGALVAEMARMILARSGPVPEHRMKHNSIGGLIDCEEFETRFRVKVLWQAYGMTEANPCPAGLEPLGGREHTIGMPMDYIEYGVVDSEDRLLPPGETGELVLRTAPHFMFERYLHDETATGRAFRGGFFHTGDRMSISPEGLLAFRGRAGERIRHHGENVDPRAIEIAALRFPRVQEAAAYGVPGALGDDDVKLDIVAEPGFDLAALRNALAGELPKKAVPRYLELLQELPRTATFRVKKHSLRERSLTRPEVLDAEAGR